MYIYASLSLIISLIKLMSINYAYNNKKSLTWISMKGTGCYILPTYRNFVREIYATPGLRNIPGRRPITRPRATQVALSFDVPRAPLSTKWPCSLGLAFVDPRIGH